MEISKELRKTVKRIFLMNDRPRGRRLSPVHDAINGRDSLERQFKKNVENGMIGVIREGVDCDCTSFHYESIRKVRSLFWEHRSREEAYQEAEGPLSLYFVKPSSIDPENNYSRDLALEAFENGHPHVVYY